MPLLDVSKEAGGHNLRVFPIGMIKIKAKKINKPRGKACSLEYRLETKFYGLITGSILTKIQAFYSLKGSEIQASEKIF